MSVKRRFSVILAVGLLTTLSIKTLFAASVLRPTNDVVASMAGEELSRQGYQVAGLGVFAGRIALLAGKDGCLIYLVPVSEQGWHQETVRKALSSDQSLSFLYKGELYPGDQPRWPPLLNFYVSLALSYMGMGPGFDPVYALISSNGCDLQSPKWNLLKSLPYRKESVFSFQDADDV